MTPIEIARSYLPSEARPQGTPWAHQGRSRHAMDCIGLLVVAFAAYGIQDRKDYSRDPSDGMLERHVREQFGEPIPLSEIRPGDVVLMAFPKIVRHIGIVGDHPGGLSLIHTDAAVKRVTEHRLDDRWLKRVRYVHRWGGA